MGSKYTIELSHQKMWFYRLVTEANGQTLMTSETYLTKFNARRAAKRIAAKNGFNYREVL